MELVKRSQSISPAALHLRDNREIYGKEFIGPVGVRLSSWYTPGAGEDPFGREGGKPGFLITPLPPACSPAGEVAETIVNLPAQTLFVNAGLLYVPFACRISYVWPDLDTTVNVGTANFELQACEAPRETRFCYAHYLRNAQTMTVRREVQAISCPYPFAALTLDGGASVVPFGEWPTPIGGTRTLTMGFLPGIPAAITRVPVTLYY